MPEQTVTDYLITQGGLGLACLVLGLVIIYQHRKININDRS